MAFMFKLVLEDGTPADPPVLDTAVPNWRSGDVITLGPSRSLRGDRLPAGLGRRAGASGRNRLDGERRR
jgi:hypothetical protein